MNQQDAIEEIALIRRVMDESRRFTSDSGKYYIMWGIIIAVAIFAQYAVNLTQNESLSVWIWAVAIGLGVIVSVFFGMREGSTGASWPVGAKLIALIWGSSFVSMILIGVIGPLTGALRSWAICPAMAAIMGSAYIISSLAYRMKWVAMVGTAWWLGSLVMFWIHGIATLPIYGVMMIFFEIVPGLVFYRVSKISSEGNPQGAWAGENNIV